jgi:hypothetical protein
VRTQVTFDCADPHGQARFWAAVYRTEVEDHSELVDQLVAAGRLPAADRIEVDRRSAFRDVAACSDPDGVEPRLFFQRVPVLGRLGFGGPLTYVMRDPEGNEFCVH